MVAKPYQLALLIKKSLDNIKGIQQSACEATLQYQYYNIHFSHGCHTSGKSCFFQGQGNVREF